MATFGEQLRRERELRGITLAELSYATRVNLRYLEALEKDRFDLLPGGVFNRGFVRAVARYIKLDEHYWVGEYVRAAHEEPEILARYAPPNAELPAPPRRGIWSFALLLLAFGVAAYFVHDLRVRRPAEASPPLLAAPGDRASTPPGSVLESSAAEPASDVTSTRKPPTPSGALTTTPVSTTEYASELRLQVDALEEAWVSVTVDGDPLFQRLMKPGETRSIRALDRIELITGNASAVVLTLNGETLAPLGNPGERKNVVLTAKDLKPSLP